MAAFKKLDVDQTIAVQRICCARFSDARDARMSCRLRRAFKLSNPLIDEVDKGILNLHQQGPEKLIQTLDSAIATLKDEETGLVATIHLGQAKTRRVLMVFSPREQEADLRFDRRNQLSVFLHQTAKRRELTLEAARLITVLSAYKMIFMGFDSIRDAATKMIATVLVTAVATFTTYWFATNEKQRDERIFSQIGMPAKDAIAEIKTTAAGIIDALTSLKSGLLVAYGNQEKAQGQ